MADEDLPAGEDPLSKVESSAGAVVLETTADAAILRVTGALDLALAPKLQQVVERAARLQPALMVIDQTGVDFLASAGMSVLLRAHRTRPENTQVRLVAESRIILRPLQVTRLTDELEVHPTMSAALAG
jgi:anti-anti-sigma factor